MTKFTEYEAQVQGWATAHVIAALIIALGVGFALGMLIG